MSLSMGWKMFVNELSVHLNEKLLWSDLNIRENNVLTHSASTSTLEVGDHSTVETIKEIWLELDWDDQCIISRASQIETIILGNLDNA